MFRTLLALVVLIAAGAPLAAQDFPEPAKPTKEHEWLKQFVGHWDTTAEASFGPDQKMECNGKSEGRMLGEYWVVNEGEMTPMGFVMKSVQTIGFDPEKKKFVGTFVSSADGTLWHYLGWLDESGKRLILEADGPNMLTGKTTKFRDEYEFKSPDHILMESLMLGDDGKWVTFMTGNMHRKK